MRTGLEPAPPRGNEHDRRDYRVLSTNVRRNRGRRELRKLSLPLRAYPNNRLTVRRMKPDGYTGTAVLCPNQSSFATGYAG